MNFQTCLKHVDGRVDASSSQSGMHHILLDVLTGSIGRETLMQLGQPDTQRGDKKWAGDEDHREMVRTRNMHVTKDALLRYTGLVLFGRWFPQ